MDDLSDALRYCMIEWWDKLNNTHGMYMAEHATYRGTKVIVHSKNYQTGAASVAEILADGNQGPAFIVDIADLKSIQDLDVNPWWGTFEPTVPKCECGNDAVRESSQGRHSDWCPKYTKGI